MRKPHRKQRLAWLLTAALLLTHLPVSILSEEIIETPIQAETSEQDEPKIGTVKYYAQIHLQVWQNSVCTGLGNLPLIT